MTEDEMVGWHHRLNRHEFEQAPGVGERQRRLACCSPWDHKDSHITEWLKWTENTHHQLTEDKSRWYSPVVHLFKRQMSPPCKEPENLCTLHAHCSRFYGKTVKLLGEYGKDQGHLLDSDFSMSLTCLLGCDVWSYFRRMVQQKGWFRSWKSCVQMELCH